MLCAVLSACTAPWSTRTAEDIFPPVLDPQTSLVLVEAVTVTRCADGTSVTVSGPEVELFYAGFENAACTRRSGSVTPMYTVRFHLTEQAADFEEVTIGEYRGTVCLTVGKYRYRPVTVNFDLSYIESLFAK